MPFFMNQQNHRWIGMVGVPILLILLQLKGALQFNYELLGLVLVGGIVGYLFGGGVTSPDMDITFGHRNPITHSTLIPYILLVVFKPVNQFVHIFFIMIFLAWFLHVFVDYFSEKDEFAFEFDPSEWMGGTFSYIASWVIMIGSWILLFTITPLDLFF